LSPRQFLSRGLYYLRTRISGFPAKFRDYERGGFPIEDFGNDGTDNKGENPFIIPQKRKKLKD